MISHDPDFPVTEGDALLFAVALPEDDERPDILSQLGFGPATGVDVALNHEGMLAHGLQLQEEYDEYDCY